MKKHTLWLIAAITVFIVSCNKKPKHLSFIPNNSAGVIALDVKSIGQKSVTLSDVINSFSSKDSLRGKIEQSGIDILNNIYFFGSGTGEKDVELGALFIINDAAKFEKFALEQVKAADTKFETKGDVKYFRTENGLVGYKGDVAVAIFSKNSSENRVVDILTAKEENTLLGANKNFADNIKSSADIKFWLDYGKIADMVQKTNPMASSFGLADYKDSYINSDINFEDGKIDGKYHMDGSKELFEKLSKLSKASVNADVVKNHPGNDLIMSYAMALDLKEFVKQYTAFKGPVDMYLSQLSEGLNVDYITETLSGDIVMTVNGIQVVQKERYDYLTDSTYLKPEPNVNFALSLGVADNKKLNPLLDTLAAKGLITKNGNNYTVIGGMASIFVKEGSLQIVGQKEYADQIALGNTEKITGDNLSLLTSNASAFTLDLTKIKPEVFDAFDKDAKDYFNMITIESMVAKGSKPSGQSSKGEFVINFKDKKQNSLKSLHIMFTELKKKADAEKKKRDEEYERTMESLQSLDSAAVATDSVAAPTELP